MSTIGSIVVNLASETADFLAGTGKATSALESFASSGVGLASQATASFFHIAEEAGHAIADWVEQTTIAVAQNLRLAQTLGTTSTALQELQSAAGAKGIGVEQMSGALEPLEKNLGEVAQGGGAKAAAALDALGLSASKLSNEGADAAFEEIADKIAAIQSPTQQAVAAFELFGKSGQQLLPILREGAAGIEASKARALEFGSALSEMDNSRIVGMGQSFHELEERTEGAKNELTAALAPALTQLANQVLDLLPTGDKLQEVFTGGLHMIGTGVGYLLDGWKIFKVAILEVAATGEELFATMIDGLAKVASAMDWIIQKTTGIHTGLGEAVSSFAADAHTAADVFSGALGEAQNDLANNPWPHENVDSWFNNAKAKSDELAKSITGSGVKFGEMGDEFQVGGKKIQETLDSLKKDVATFGLSAGGKKLFDLAGEGADPMQLAEAAKLVDKLDQLQADKSGNEELAKLNTEMDKLQGKSSVLDEIDAKFKNMGLSPQLLQQLEEAGKKIDALKEKKKEEEFLEKHQSVAGVERRFDFRLPDHGQAKSGGESKASKTADAHLKVAEQSLYYTQEIYRFQRNQDQNSTQVVDL